MDTNQTNKKMPTPGKYNPTRARYYLRRPKLRPKTPASNNGGDRHGEKPNQRRELTPTDDQMPESEVPRRVGDIRNTQYAKRLSRDMGAQPGQPVITWYNCTESKGWLRKQQMRSRDIPKYNTTNDST